MCVYSGCVCGASPLITAEPRWSCGSSNPASCHTPNGTSCSFWTVPHRNANASSVSPRLVTDGILTLNIIYISEEQPWHPLQPSPRILMHVLFKILLRTSHLFSNPEVSLQNIFWPPKYKKYWSRRNRGGKKRESSRTSIKTTSFLGRKWVSRGYLQDRLDCAAVSLHGEWTTDTNLGICWLVGTRERQTLAFILGEAAKEKSPWLN